MHAMSTWLTAHECLTAWYQNCASINASLLEPPALGHGRLWLACSSIHASLHWPPVAGNGRRLPGRLHKGKPQQPSLANAAGAAGGWLAPACGWALADAAGGWLGTVCG